MKDSIDIDGIVEVDVTALIARKCNVKEAKSKRRFAGIRPDLSNRVRSG